MSLFEIIVGSIVAGTMLLVVGPVAFLLGLGCGHVRGVQKLKKWMTDNACYLCQEKFEDEHTWEETE